MSPSNHVIVLPNTIDNVRDIVLLFRAIKQEFMCGVVIKKNW